MFGGRHLHRRRQIEDGPLLRRRLPHVSHRLADLQRVAELGAGEALGRVLVADFRALELLRELPNQSRAIHRNLGNAGLVEVEHHPPLQG